MARDADNNASRRVAENKFPYRIDIPIPVGGLGTRLTEMLMWCRRNTPAGTWAQHGHGGRSGSGGTPAVSARFYFANEADAEAFRRQWMT